MGADFRGQVCIGAGLRRRAVDAATGAGDDAAPNAERRTMDTRTRATETTPVQINGTRLWSRLMALALARVSAAGVA